MIVVMVMMVIMRMVVIVIMIVVMIMCGIWMFVGQKLGVDIQNRIEVKAADVQNLLEICFTEIDDFNGSARVHMHNATAQSRKVGIRDQIFFGDEDAIGKADLFLRFFLYVQRFHTVFSVNDCDD